MNRHSAYVYGEIDSDGRICSVGVVSEHPINEMTRDHRKGVCVLAEVHGCDSYEEARGYAISNFNRTPLAKRLPLEAA